MNPRHNQLVRDTFALLEPVAPQAAALFYDNLFRADPTLRGLFRGDIALQGARLMAMIGGAVQLLDHPTRLLPILRDLGARHVGYSVREHHYAVVGSALLVTLRQGLGDAFTDEVHAAWVGVYDVIRTAMIAGAREAVVAA